MNQLQELYEQLERFPSHPANSSGAPEYYLHRSAVLATVEAALQNAKSTPPYTLTFPHKLQPTSHFLHWLESLPPLYEDSTMSSARGAAHWDRSLYNYHRLFNAIGDSVKILSHGDKPTLEISVEAFEKAMIRTNTVKDTGREAEVGKLKATVEYMDSVIVQRNAMISNNNQDHAQVVAALRAYEDAFSDLFGECCSNPIKNAWGKEVDMTKLNEAHCLAGAALKNLPPA